ncbi:MAG: tetratricopeptide repeat protein [Tepidisphaerales bacterium]
MGTLLRSAPTGPVARFAWVIVVATLLGGARAGFACGPFFPNHLLFGGDAAVLDAPRAEFYFEIHRLLPSAGTPFKTVPQAAGQDVYAQTAAKDEAELAAALGEMGVPAQTVRARVEDYTRVRARLAEHGRTSESAARWATNAADTQAAGQGVLADVRVPSGLPPEFDDYFRGALAYHRGQMEEARAAWQQLLARPAKDRRYRSTWAAFMIGRSYVDADPAKAVTWLTKTRELAQQGYADSTGLAAASLGWEGRAELRQQHLGRAIELYMSHYASGDGWAITSLQYVGDAAMKSQPAELKQLAADPLARKVLTAYIVAKGGPYHPTPNLQQATAWLQAIEAAGATAVENADRLAWAAYQCGQMQLAARWAERAPADAPLALWVRGKLLLRAGKLDQAAALFAKAVRAFGQDPTELWDSGPDRPAELKAQDQAAGELAVLQLSRRQFVESLDLFLRSGWWQDAAYVAERVLTADELKGYVDRSWPHAGPPVPAVVDRVLSIPDRDAAKASAATSIRHLLARRLTRLGRWREARAYFPAALQVQLDVYVSAIRAGSDSKRSASDRAASLFEAARIARKQGMELLGMELGPDGAIHAGEYPEDTEQREGDGKATVVRPTREELDRFAASAAKPDMRFHYRYIAADHAWAAAELLPDNTDNKAAILCEAGGWLKNRDPKAAQRFYAALVKHCGNTALGRQAADLHWFPK